MVTRIQVRRDTAVNWTTNNPVLYTGEPGLETDTGKIKYGNGTSGWNDLVYSFGTPGATGLGATGPTGATGLGATGATGPIGATGSTAGNIPIGGIILWSGASNAIPTGWQICDGTNSTPNLVNRFVVGAGSTYVVGATGGSADAIVVSHSHSVTDPGHHHTLTTLAQPDGTDVGSSNAARVVNSHSPYDVVSTEYTGISIASTGTSSTGANLPPYYALCYIMRTS